MPDGRNSRLNDALNILSEIEKLTEEHAVDGVLFGGDMFHARGTINVRAFNEVCHGLARIKMRVDFFGVLVGNHDQSDRKGSVYSTNTFKSFLTVMDEPDWYAWQADVDVLAIPYHPGKKALLERIHNRVSSRVVVQGKPCPTLLLGHFGISGGKVGSNFVLVSEHEINLNELPHGEFDQVFLGHYHLPQKLLPNVRFIGATHQHNWGDIGQDRGCWIWDTHADDKFSDPSFIPLEAGPRFTLLPYDNVINAKVDLDVNNCFVRVACPPTLSAEQWVEVAQLVLDGGARKVEPWIEVSQHAGKLNPNHAKFNPGVDFEDMIERYVEVEEHELDPARLTELGQAILKEVS
jgi:DNA repair exonuclease SbcCD nuclease subunit